MAKIVRVVRFTLAMAAMVLALGSSSETTAAEKPGTAITGTVADSSGAVLVGASVSIAGPSGGMREATTDPRGRYRLEVAAGTYTVTAFRQGFAPMVHEVVVTEAAPATADFKLSPAGFAEEVTVSFTREHAQTALKMDADVKDIPFTVKSYTNSFIKAVDTKQIADLYTYMNGINRDGDTAYDFSIRGFDSGTNNLETNGMPGLAARMKPPNIANVERIEILKGPASVLYGQAEPGGLVNITTKRPQAERQNTLDLRTGTFFGTGPGFDEKVSYRGGVDFTGPFDADRKLLYRLVAVYDKDEGFRDFVVDDELFVVPSITWNMSQGTVLTLEAEYRKIDTALDMGLIAPANDRDFIARSTVRYQEPDDHQNEDGWSANAYFTKLFSAGATWNLNWRSVFHDNDRKGFETQTMMPDNIRVRRRDRHQVNHREYHFLDTNVRKGFTTGSVVHNVMLGLNGGYEQEIADRVRFGNTGFFVNVYEPEYGLYALPANGRPGTLRNFTYYRYGGYAQDHIDLSRQWKGLASLRYDWEDQKEVETRFNNPTKENTIGALVPTAGLVFQPDERWSLYGSFSQSFVPPPASAEDASGGNTFDPERGTQLEGGVKALLGDGKVEVTAAYYHIRKKNVLVTLGEFTEQIGKERSRGVEVDVRVQPASNWQTILGYTYTDAKVTEDTDPNRLGQPLLNTPKNAFNLWSRYDIDSGAAKGLGFGIGLIWRGDRRGSFLSPVPAFGVPEPNQPVAEAALGLPDYFRADAGIYYVKDRYELTFRINNVFDELYYESASNLIRIRPGKPREGTLSLRFRF